MDLKNYSTFLLKKNMQTLYKTQTIENIQIPQEIQIKVNERWFYLYNWIGSNDVKNSIERDFLKVLNFVWIPFAIIAILSFLLTFNPFVFLWVVLSFTLIFLVYLSVLWFLRGIQLSKNWYVVITDSAIWVNGKIVKINELYTISNELSIIEQDFEEKIFMSSTLENSKNNFIQKLKDKIWSWYGTIMRNFDEKLLFIVLALYTAYILIMGIVYIFGSFIIMFFWILINIISKYILLKSWDEVIYINDLFEKIHFESENISHEKDQVLIYLENALNGDWKEWMIQDINISIEMISNKTNIVLDFNKNLKQRLEASKYNSIFNFNIYNNWIKKQIKDPLVSIQELLEKNSKMIQISIKWLQKQIYDTFEEKLKAPLILQEKRLQIQQEQTNNYKNIIESYMKRI